MMEKCKVATTWGRTERCCKSNDYPVRGLENSGMCRKLWDATVRIKTFTPLVDAYKQECVRLV